MVNSCILERGLSWAFSENNVQKFKTHLSENYVKYKTLSAGMMIGGGIIGAELLGRSIPFLNNTYYETLLGRDSMIGKMACCLSEGTFNLIESLGENLNRLAIMCFESASASYIEKGLGIVLIAVITIVASSILAIGHVPSLLVYLSVLIAGYTAPLIPGGIVFIIGYGLWNVTEQPAISS